MAAPRSNPADVLTAGAAATGAARPAYQDSEAQDEVAGPVAADPDEEEAERVRLAADVEARLATEAAERDRRAAEAEAAERDLRLRLAAVEARQLESSRRQQSSETQLPLDHTGEGSPPAVAMAPTARPSPRDRVEGSA